MSKLVTTCAAAVALAAALSAVAAAVVAPPLLTVTLQPQATQRAAHTMAAGPRTLVVRNGSAVVRDVRLLRIPGGTESLIRFEGSFFLPETHTVVRRFGRLAPGRQIRATVTLTRGDYVLAATSGNEVTASRDLRVR